MQGTVTTPALALDTTGNACLLALALPNGNVLEKTIDRVHGHASFLLPEVEAFLHAHDLKLAELKSVLVVTGPGGFTGTRVGLAFARTLSRLTPINVYGVDAFSLLALQPETVFPSTLLVDTRRGDSFAQDFNAKREKTGNMRVVAETAPLKPLCLKPLFSADISGFTQDLAAIYVREADTSTPKHQKPYKVGEVI